MTTTEKNNQDKKTVFAVEDDIFLVKVYKTVFEKEQIEVWIAANGNEALKFLEKEPPDAVLLDLMLPGISGFDVLAEIRKNEKWKKVPVIILSNLGQPQDMERGKALGANEYIVKANVKINEVVETVKKYL